MSLSLILFGKKGKDTRVSSFDNDFPPIASGFLIAKFTFHFCNSSKEGKQALPKNNS
jgi:hypothetical protein